MVMPTAVFTEEEKVAIRHHLGYLNVQDAATFVLGSPAGIETSFIIEGAMNRVLGAAAGRARQLIGVLEKIEGQMIDDQELLAVDQVDEIKIRGTEMKELRTEYLYWRQALANVLGCYPNPFDKRYPAGAGVNVSVSH